MALSVATVLFLVIVTVFSFDVSAENTKSEIATPNKSPSAAKPNNIEDSTTIDGTATTTHPMITTTSTVENNGDVTIATNDSEIKHRTPIITFAEHLNLDTGAVKRTFYVVVALTGVVLLYFTVKGIRMRKKRKTRRYGLLAEQELEPLDGDDEDEEDMTLFEAKRQKKKGRKP